jgi:DNA repair protein RadC
MQYPKLRVELIREGDCKNAPIIACPRDVGKLISYLSKKDREHFVAIHLNAKNQVIGVEEVSIGSLTCSIVHPREVFKAAILNSADEIIVAHNHPSGDKQPSTEDCKITKKLIEAGKIIGIEVIDHIIIAEDDFLSFRAEGLAEF